MLIDILSSQAREGVREEREQRERGQKREKGGESERVSKGGGVREGGARREREIVCVSSRVTAKQ